MNWSIKSETTSPGSSADPHVSTTHLVLIPSFNSGRLLAQTVAAARSQWAPVWIVIDGSTDGSADAVEAMARKDHGLRVVRLESNGGKGAAVLKGLVAAEAGGFTHALVMDGDGQHPADRISVFMAASISAPDALVMGRPVFGADAPWVRVTARHLCNWCAVLETRHQVGDTLFGFRVYPVAPLLSVMRSSNGMRRFDFDPETVVRLVWSGTPLIHLPAAVRYPSSAEGGISHFKYLRDNLLLTRMHLRLGVRAAIRLAGVWAGQWKSGSSVQAAPVAVDGTRGAGHHRPVSRSDDVLHRGGSDGGLPARY